MLRFRRVRGLGAASRGFRAPSRGFVRQGTPRAEQNSLPGRGLALRGALFSFENTLQLKLDVRKWYAETKPLISGACRAQWRGLKILERVPKFSDRGFKF